MGSAAYNSKADSSGASMVFALVKLHQWNIQNNYYFYWLVRINEIIEIIIICIGDITYKIEIKSGS